MRDGDSIRGAFLPSESPSGQPTRDFALGLGLLVLASWILYTAVRMGAPRGWATAPGLVPGLLAISLGVMAAGLMVRALREGALPPWRWGFLDLRLSDAFRGAVKQRILVLGLLLVYVYLLLPYLHFEIASLLYVAVMLKLMNRRLLVHLAIYAAVLMALSASFVLVFGTPLPGKGSFLETVNRILWHAQ